PLLKNKSPGDLAGAFGIVDGEVSAYANHVLRLRSLGALLDLELHFRTFVESLVSLGSDGGIMNEDVRTVLTRDEAIALAVVEPLHPSLGHDQNLLAETRSGRGTPTVPGSGVPRFRSLVFAFLDAALRWKCRTRPT